MEILFALFFLLTLGFFSERTGGTTWSKSVGEMARDIIEGTKRLEALKLKETKEAIAAHREEIIAALEKHEKFVATLPCAYRLIITGTRETPKVEFDPCSENLVV